MRGGGLSEPDCVDPVPSAGSLGARLGIWQAVSMEKSGADWVVQLRDPDDDVAHEARLFLGSLESSEAWMLDDIVDGTYAHDHYTRFWCTTALHRLGAAATPAADQIVRLLRDPYPAIRSVASMAVLSVSPPEEGVQMLLDIARSDKDKFVRQAAIRSLIKASPGVRARIVNGLVPLLEDSDGAYYTAISLKCILSDEGGVPEGVDGEVLRTALSRASECEESIARQARDALAAITASEAPSDEPGQLTL